MLGPDDLSRCRKWLCPLLCFDGMFKHGTLALLVGFSSGRLLIIAISSGKRWLYICVGYLDYWLETRRNLDILRNATKRRRDGL